MLVRMWKKGNPPVRLVGMQIGAATMEKRKEIPQKLRLELPYDLEIPLVSIYLKKTKTLIPKKIYAPLRSLHYL